MTWVDFGLRLSAALFLGGLIGLERQWRQRMAGLRTNGLVAAGSAMFVMMGGLIAGNGSQDRVAAYVVTGIGFLGGGVILKDGFNIRGMNTAATLWCTAAVGTLAGLGRSDFAAIGALGVLSANLILRPVAYRMNRAPVEKREHEILYRLRCTCRTSDESNIRTMLIRLSLEAGATAISWEVVAAVDADEATISATEELGLNA